MAARFAWFPGVWLALQGLAGAATYQVSPSGLDTNTGTEATPWRTVQKAANTAVAGDTVLVHAGLYAERVSFPRSGGGPASRIVFKAAPGEVPVLDGTGLTVPTDDDAALFRLVDVSYITVEGFEVRNYRTTLRHAVPMGVLVAGNSRGVELRRLNVHHIETAHAGPGAGNAHGIAVFGWDAQPVRDLVVSGCEVHDLRLGASEALVLNGNVIDFLVEDNEVRHCDNIGIDFIGYEGVAPTGAVDRARSGVCRGNRVHHIDSAFNPAYNGNPVTGGGDQSAGGIYVDGGADIVIERNVVHHCNIGIEVASEAPGRRASRILVRNNVVHHNDAGGLFLGGYDESVGGTEQCVVRHNTFYRNDLNGEWNGEIFFQHHTENNTITHNIFHADAEGMLIGGSATTNAGDVLDRNLYYAAVPTEAKWTWRRTVYPSFAAYRAASGQDALSSFANPQFTNVAAENLTLAPGSPAVNAGDPAFAPALGELDGAGNQRVFAGRVDLGAFEQGSRPALPVLGFSPSAGLDFGFVVTGGPAAVRELRILNRGGEDLVLSEWLFEGPGAAAYSAPATLPGPIPPDGSAVLPISLLPLADGPQSAGLRLRSNTGVDALVPLQGEGFTPLAGSGGIPRMSDLPPPVLPPLAAGFATPAAGAYHGLCLENAAGAAASRIQGLRLAATGSFSATLAHQGRSYRLRGGFSAGGAYSANLTKPDGGLLHIGLSLFPATDGSSSRITGTLTGAGEDESVALFQAVFHAKQRPAPQAGRYTVLLPAEDPPFPGQPGGHGWGLLTINGSGVGRVTGVLGDGARFTAASVMASDGRFPFHADLYRTVPRGSLGGWVFFRDLPTVSDCDGALVWRKRGDPREPLFPGGFQKTQRWLGSRYLPPASGLRVLASLAARHHNARLSLVDAALPAGPLRAVVSWQGNHRIAHYGPVKLAAAVNASTGQVGGSYSDLAPPGAGLRMAFAGVACQKQQIAAGQYVRGSETGYLAIEPGTGFSYPGSEDPGPLALLEAPSPPPAPVAESAIAWTASAAGLYQGTLADPGTGTTMGGLYSLALSRTGAFSGNLYLGTARFVVRGTLAADGGAVVVLANATLTLQLTQSAGNPADYQLAGVLEVDAVGHALDAQRFPSGYTKALRHPQAGAYTVALPAPAGADALSVPGGDGYGALTVNYQGAGAGLLVLPDGTRITLSGPISPGGEWPFFRLLYGKRPAGYIGGRVAFRVNPGIGEADGLWHWVKPAGAPPTTIYPNGFDLVRPLVGSRYTVAAGTRAFPGLSDGTHNFWLRLRAPNLALPGYAPVPDLSRAGTWTTANRIVFYGPENVALKMARNGLISGSFFDGVAGVRVRFGAALLQSQNLAAGHVLVNGHSGLAGLRPRP